jgi:precorrin-4 methylase
VSHPSLGLPPPDRNAGRPAAASAVIAARSRLAARALEVAVDADPTFRERYAELALRELLSDTQAMVDRLALALGTGDPAVMGSWAEQLAPRYRKRRVPMDDVIGIAEGLRAAAATAVAPDDVPGLHAAIDAAVAALRWHRRLGGDARKRNPVIAFIYKGA